MILRAQRSNVLVLKTRFMLEFYQSIAPGAMAMLQGSTHKARLQNEGSAGAVR